MYKKVQEGKKKRKCNRSQMVTRSIPFRRVIYELSNRTVSVMFSATEPLQPLYSL